MVTINPLTGASAAIQQGTQRSGNKLLDAVRTLVTGIKVGGDQVSNLSVAALLQSELTGLKAVQGNLAQASSLAQVADGASEQISNALDRMRAVAMQAKSPTLNAENRAALNEEFVQLRNEVDRIAGNTQFGGKTLLDGTFELSLEGVLGQEGGDASSTLSLGDLSAASLLGGANVLTAENADQALDAVRSALENVVSTRASIGSFQEALDYGAASVATAYANQAAAQSSLSDADFGEASTGYSLASLQQNAALALAAQGNRLAPSLLQLVG